MPGAPGGFDSPAQGFTGWLPGDPLAHRLAPAIGRGAGLIYGSGGLASLKINETL